ncbi:MAG: biotin/lipoyl-binding protein [Anaerolineae bacterium]|nr:MAG: biotin/lipoyl-binding protein [Anaerolineae bacterium]
MPEALELRIPLVNPNEREALLAALHVKPGQQVKPGDLLYTLETTKSTHEVEAPAGGYLMGLRAAEGDTVRAGDLIGWLADSPDWTPPAAPEPAAAEAGDGLPPGLRITAPARALAEGEGLDLAALPVGPLVTEGMVREALAAQGGGYEMQEEDFYAVLVYGGGGHGKSVIELLQAAGGWRVAGVVDDGLPQGGRVLASEVLGGGGSLNRLYASGIRRAVNAVGGIGDLASRQKVFERLKAAGFAFPTVVHPTAFVEASAALAEGVQVFPHAYVGSEARIGFGCIINTGAIVSHDCVLEEVVNLSPGAILAGGVKVGTGALVGMGVTVNLGVTIGARARIGNGATVKSDVPQGGIVRAGSVWPE